MVTLKSYFKNVFHKPFRADDNQALGKNVKKRLLSQRVDTAQKYEVFCYGFFSVNPKQTADLVTFTEEVLNGKLYFL